MGVHVYVNAYMYAVNVRTYIYQTDRQWSSKTMVTCVRFQTRMEDKIANLQLKLAQKDEEIQLRKFRVNVLLIHLCNSLHFVTFPQMLAHLLAHNLI